MKAKKKLEARTMLNNNNSVKPLPAEKDKKEKKKLFHVEKRFNMALWQSILIRFGFIIFAVFMGLLVLTMAYGINPFLSFGNLFKGAFGDFNDFIKGNFDRLWEFLRDSALLLGVGLALIPAFKMKFWNLGGNGQIAIGALVCLIMMVELGGKMPDIVVVLISVIASVVAGAIWAAIPSIFKAFFDTNESLFTLMMNYIATGLVSVWIYWRFPGNSNVVPTQSNGRLPVLFNDKLLIIILVAALFVGILFYLKFSKHGYELSVVGESVNTARYVGINSKKVIIRTLIMSGALCGFVGFLIGSGVDYTITAETTHRGMGFTAIMAVWLAKFNPIVTIFTALFITFITKGMGQVQMANSRFITDASATSIVMGLIYLFVIASEFFIEYKIMYNKNGKETDVLEIIGGFFKNLFGVKGKIKKEPAKKSIDSDEEPKPEASLDEAKQILEPETSPSKKKATSGRKKSQKGSK